MSIVGDRLLTAYSVYAGRWLHACNVRFLCAPACVLVLFSTAAVNVAQSVTVVAFNTPEP